MVFATEPHIQRARAHIASRVRGRLAYRGEASSGRSGCLILGYGESQTTRGMDL